MSTPKETIEIELKLFNLLLNENPEIVNYGTNGNQLFFKNSVWKVFYDHESKSAIELQAQLEELRGIADQMREVIQVSISKYQFDLVSHEAHSIRALTLFDEWKKKNLAP